MNDWYKRADTEETNIEIKTTDLQIKIGGYVFIVQTENGFNNIILKKVEESKFSIREAFRCFRLFLISKKIQFIRIEGSLRRYNFLKKMFPFCDFKKDDSIKDRNVFYVRIYDTSRS